MTQDEAPTMTLEPTSEAFHRFAHRLAVLENIERAAKELLTDFNPDNLGDLRRAVEGHYLHYRHD